MAKIVFMGTPEFAVPTLQALIKHHEVIGVVTQPDRPAGRGGIVRMSPIKELALSHDIPVFQPEKLRRKEAIEELKQWQPDVYIVAAFGQILPQTVLDIPPHGSLNVHASLLPRWRGAAPIHAAIRAGDETAGITIMKIDAGLDTGPMLTQDSLPIEPYETSQTLHDKMAQLGAKLLTATLPAYLSGEIQPQPQPEEIDWSQDAVTIERLVRAFTPWPGTYTSFQGKQLKIHAGEYGEGKLAAGKVAVINGHVAIGTGEGIYFPTEVQLEGKKRVDIDSFVNGYKDFIGAVLPS
jgi:methionyl-tRNA formyltransferase